MVRRRRAPDSISLGGSCRLLAAPAEVAGMSATFEGRGKQLLQNLKMPDQRLTKRVCVILIP